MLYIDPAKCSGCRTCELVCSMKNEGMARPSLSRIQVIAFKYQGTRVPVTCQQCEDPVCIAVCPMRALQKDPDLGIVRHDKERCMGCKTCVAACPFGGISFSTESKQIFKCEQCNGDPQCVRFCLDHAITYVDPDTVSSRRKREKAKELSQFVERAGSH
jgi:anaerobic carbon-monoxide dehydrogenase iron sulfur subunit